MRADKKTIWMLSAQLLNIVVNLSLGFVIAKYLGPSSYGLYATFLLTFSLGSILILFGLETVLVNELVKSQDNSLRLITAAIVMRSAMWFIILLICAVVNINSDLVSTFVVFGFLCSGFEIFQVFNVGLEAREKFISIAKVKIFTAISMGFLKVYALLISSSVEMFVYIYFAERIFYISLWGICYWPEIRIEKTVLTAFQLKTDIHDLLIKSSWVFAAALTTFLHTRVDQLIILQFGDTAEFGVYSLAVRVVEVIYFVPAILCNMVMPQIVKTKNEQDSDGYSKFLQAKTTQFFWLSVLLTGLVIFGIMIIDLYLGADFVGFASIATIYTLAIPAVFMSNLSKKILVAESKSRVLLSRSIIGIVGNCILSIVFYQWFGAIGCAIASVISFWFIGYFSSALNQESRHIFVMQSLSFNPLRLVK